jgi:hypothetical protein
MKVCVEVLKPCFFIQSPQGLHVAMGAIYLFVSPLFSSFSYRPAHSFHYCKCPKHGESIKTCLHTKGLFSPQSSQLSFPDLEQPISSPIVVSHSESTGMSRKLSDLFDPRKESELMTDPDFQRTCQGLQQPLTESLNEPAPETPDVPSGESSMPEAPAVLRSATCLPLNGAVQSVTYPAQSHVPCSSLRIPVLLACVAQRHHWMIQRFFLPITQTPESP